jgi:hypothetical protein
MKSFVFIIILVFLHFDSFGHPLHISVASFDYNKEKNKFELTIKLFTIDLEDIILKNQNINLKLGSPDEFLESTKFIDKYIQDNLIFKVNQFKKNKTKINYIKREITDDSIWLYYEIPINKKLKRIQIVNTLLNDLFSDQSNLLILKFNDLEFAEKLTLKDTIRDFNLANIKK